MVYPMSTEKITRTIRLTPEVNQRLVDLCEHIGTNPNAYLISEIGKAVSRDEVAFNAQKNNTSIYQDQLIPFIQNIEKQISLAAQDQPDMLKDDEG